MSLTLFNLISVGLISLCLAASVLSSNILILWILIEISGFCLIYMFLSCDSNSNVSLSSFLFYLTNGISSILIVSGAFLESPILLEFGLCSKFFIFPFSIILFHVFNNISWGVIFIVGSMFKVFILGLSSIVNVLINWELLMGTIITCIFFIGFVTLNIKGLWFILNLSSSVVLFVGCVVLNNEDIFGLLLMYLVLSIINVYLLSSLDLTNNTYVSVNNSATLSYLMFLVGFPVSLNIVYKILSAVAILSISSSTLLLVWMMYIIIETGFLFLYFSNILSNLKSLY
uniref:NADH dehydrogenase subunit 2 n=1 Tax=Gyrodactylus brachymystacis TaxID=369907 RepID=A0A1C8FNG8_9PLAT|nr:NADH dehydrogenase subunit 2 [Gyrodactylus brachymystacis]AMO02263.1 NADH dehydrogenase subunit 2 [Gyrodactylus brachymystacis]